MDVAVETFQPSETLSKYAEEYGWNEGTVEVTFQGCTQRVKCIAGQTRTSEWTIYGLCARYETGSKVWRAVIHFNPETRFYRVTAGFDNRSRRFSRPRLTGFTDQVSEKHISKR